ncbi:MAG: hypothetical protein EOS40_04665 [Mesorhizobium sp.]|nr:MAG: hypothetical protein EOS40_04665 [Mesorhizobium sp.]
MMAEYVELVLLEQSFASINWPFFDRVGDVAEKTDGSVLFDIRIEGDTTIQRMAVIGYGANGTVAIMMDKSGRFISAPVNGDDDVLVAELTGWYSLPMAEQIRVSYHGVAAQLLAKLVRNEGRRVRRLPPETTVT